MRSARFALGIAAALLLAAFLVGVAADSTSAQESVTVNLAAATGPDGGGDQPGTATLTPSGDQTEVVVNIEPSPDGAEVEQPAHIHSGTCDNLPSSLGAVEYPLENVVNGTSTTMVDVSLDSLQTGDFAINVHKSGTEVGVYVSCGNIPAAAAADTSADTSGLPTTGGAPPAGGGTSALTYLLIAAGAVVLAGGGALAFGFARQRR